MTGRSRLQLLLVGFRFDVERHQQIVLLCCLQFQETLAVQFLAPLIEGEDYPPYKNGIPQYARLKLEAVPKKLKGKFAL